MEGGLSWDPIRFVSVQGRFVASPEIHSSDANQVWGKTQAEIIQRYVEIFFKKIMIASLLHYAV